MDSTEYAVDLVYAKTVLKGHDKGVNCCCFSPDGKRALSASRDSRLILWDIATGKPHRELNEHRSGVNSCCFSPDGTKALSASGEDDARLILWDFAAARKQRQLTGAQRQRKLLLLLV